MQGTSLSCGLSVDSEGTAILQQGRRVTGLAEGSWLPAGDARCLRPALPSHGGLLTG